MVKPFLHVRSLSFAYGDRKALRGVSFQLPRGEFLGVAGPNGSGKSTLLYLLAGLLPPSSGKVELEGNPTSPLRREEWARVVGMVFQEVPTDIFLPCFEVVLLGRFPHLRRFRRESEADYQAVEKAMHATATASFADRPLGELSGGERQRVMLARALAQEPELLLLDEPTSHLDVLHQLEIMDILLSLRRKGMTVVGVFHDLNLVSQFCTRALFLKAGKILRDGPINEVMHVAAVEELLNVEFLEEVHPHTYRPFFMPLKRREPVKKEGERVHIVCGGGSGIPLMRALTEHGFQVSVGMVNKLDTDEETARRLGLPVAAEKPFSPLGPETAERFRILAGQSRWVVVAPTYWGYGNLENLRQVLTLVRKGKQVIIFEEGLREDYDFTEGEARHLLGTIRSSGAIIVSGIEALLAVFDGK